MNQPNFPEIPQKHSFWSDNAAPVHPKIMEAIAAVNAGHALSYGGDEITKAACAAFDRLFGRSVHTEFAFNGTGANCLALALCAPQSYDAVVCADVAHIHTDECAAPEHLAGVKLIPLPTADGKLTPDQVLGTFSALGSMHHAQPKVLSLSQCTEWGTVYTVGEIRALSDAAHEGGLLVHMDGARIANAAVGQGVPLAEMTLHAGVDVLSFGGTKNGLMFGEAVIVFEPAMARRLPFVKKNNAQLFSKMRYIAAQYLSMLEENLWMENAASANRMADLLANQCAALGFAPAYPVQANELFLRLPEAVATELMKTQRFHVMEGGLARLVCSWDTAEQDIRDFGEDLKAALDS